MFGCEHPARVAGIFIEGLPQLSFKEHGTVTCLHNFPHNRRPRLGIRNRCRCRCAWPPKNRANDFLYQASVSEQLFGVVPIPKHTTREVNSASFKTVESM